MANRSSGAGGSGGSKRAFSSLSELMTRLCRRKRLQWNQCDYDMLYTVLSDCDFFNQLGKCKRRLSSYP